MLQNIDAVYEEGVFRPLETLKLPEKQRVKIQVDIEKQTESVESVFRFMSNIDCLTLPSGKSSVEPVSLLERERVAHILGKCA